MSDDNVMRVAPKTDVKTLGAAIAHAIYEGHEPVLRCVGAGALNQAVKGSVVANTFIAQRGMSLALRPGMESVQGHTEEISAITLRVCKI